MKKFISSILLGTSLATCNSPAFAQQWDLTNNDLTIGIQKNSSGIITLVGKWLANFSVVGDSVKFVYQQNQDDRHFTLYFDKDSVNTPAIASSSALYDTLKAWTTGSGGGATVFTDLTDVPNNYTGDGLKLVRVNAGETGLEFFTSGAGGEDLAATLAIGNTTSGSDIRVSAGDSIQITDATANRIAAFSGNQKLQSLATATYPDLTELSYVKGVTSAIQTQLNAKQPLDADLTSWAGVTRAAGFDVFTATPSSANLRTLLSDENGTGVALFDGSTSATFVTPILGTPTSGNLANCTFPTLNQNTTGSAASLSISGQTGLLTVTGLTSTNRVKTVRDAADTFLELGGSYTPTGTWTSLTMVTPVLGTPTSGTLTNCTGLPISTGVSGLGTGIATALAINTGSAGAPVLFNGAGGTPSSITLTNATISAKSIWVANSANTLTEVTPGAGQSVRINAGNTAWEAFTPGTAGANTALSNLASVAINQALTPNTDNTIALGSATKRWTGAYLGDGGIVDWGNNDARIEFTTAAGRMAFTGAGDYEFDGALRPSVATADIGVATTNEWDDLFLQEGSVINFDNGDATITQTGNDITLAGISTFGVGTSTAVTLGTIELGHASNTTLSQSAAGILAVEGVAILKASSGVAASPTASGTTTVTHNLGRAPVVIEIYGMGDFTNNTSAVPTTSSIGVFSSSGNTCIYQPYDPTAVTTAEPSATSTTFAIAIYTSSGNFITGVIGNVTSTTFDIVWTETGTHTAGRYLWKSWWQQGEYFLSRFMPNYEQ